MNYLNYLENYINYIECYIYNMKKAWEENNKKYLKDTWNNIDQNIFIHSVFKYFYNNKCDKYILISYLSFKLYGTQFLDFLNNISYEIEEGNEYEGYIISNNYHINNDDYFGENKIKLYSNVGELKEDILTYNEFYNYIELACYFYTNLHKNNERKVLDILEKHQKKYLNK